MISLNLIAGAALVSLSLATWLDVVTVWHLATVAAILFAAASAPMLEHVGATT